MNTEVVTAQSLWAVVDDIQALLDTRDGLDPSDPNYAACCADLDAALHAQLRKVSATHAYRAHAIAMQSRCDMMQRQFLNARLEWERTIERLDEYMIAIIEKTGKKEIEGDGLKIKLKANPPSVVITDELLIPNAYKTQAAPKPPPPPVPSKALIAKALKAGIDVPGADLNIDSVRVDWGDPPKSKGAGAAVTKAFSEDQVRGAIAG